MALFQKSILNEYLKRQDKIEVAKAYKKFVKYFYDPVTQKNIRDINEEGFQQKFLMELFVTCFGYVMSPDPDYNLTTEFKNLKDAKKADGAILIDGKAIAVIELKGTNTKNLEKCRQQAFDYKSHHPTCTYVITSNFERLRFYINTSDEFEEFNLFTLTEKQFALLYLCVLKENLLSNIPLEIKEASTEEEEVITKKFYSDYSTFKSELFRDLVKLNMKNEVFSSELNIKDLETTNKRIKLNLFKKSQKLIDRFLFIFFGEDRGLLPSNSTLDILKKWKSDVSFGDVRPLYDIFKIYFKVLDKGREGANGKAEIFAYNGGLFKPDPILESLIISDELLYKYTKSLSNYDFDSQVDVNILGHIFENSLNDIENIHAEIEGGEFDKQRSKRKKDGIFYTPKYITKYIIVNTIGKLCTEKKAELGVIEEEYFKSRKGRPLKTLETFKNNLEAYRNWLLQITICDPACGSGAFLNEALDFLIKEHKYIDELHTNLLGGGLVFPNIENTVLENNIFGVDLNEESVEIAKLSLWLRTAQPNRKLNDLSSNIKCGNSVIDDVEVAGDKAFNWQKEFVSVFGKGGFDVVIGNPPYVVVENKNQFKKYNWNNDLYHIFFEKILKYPFLNSKAYFSFITPRFFSVNKNCAEIRDFFLNDPNTDLIELVETTPFKDAETECLISLFKKGNNVKSDSIIIKNDSNNIISYSNTILKSYCNLNKEKEILTFITSEIINILKVIEKDVILLDEISDSRRGMEIGKKNFINEGIATLVGYDVDRYIIDFDNKYVGKYEKQYLRLSDFFKEDNLIYLRRVSTVLRAVFSSKKYAFNKNLYGIKINSQYSNKYITVLLNSRLLTYYYKNKFSTKKVDLFPEIQSYLFKSLPIKKITMSMQGAFIKQADTMLVLNKQLQIQVQKFISRVKNNLEVEKITKKVSTFYNNDFSIFVKELKNQKVILTLHQEDEWEEYFSAYKITINQLQSKIDKKEKEIDQMVYELYELSEEEVKLVDSI